MIFSALTSATGRTARAAAALAVLGGLLYLAGLLLDVVALVRFPGDAPRTAVHAAVDLLLTAVLLPGGVLLMRHDPLGRLGCIAGSATAIVATLTSLLLAATGLAYVDLGGPGDLAAAWGAGAGPGAAPGPRDAGPFGGGADRPLVRPPGLWT